MDTKRYIVTLTVGMVMAKGPRERLQKEAKKEIQRLLREKGSETYLSVHERKVRKNT